MKLKPRTIPCIFCKRPLDERTDKNQKPYFVCDDCGTQLFVRGIVGRRLLNDAVRNNLFEPTTRQSTQITRTEASSVKKDLDHLYAYIEIFCEGEIIIPDRARLDSQILFTEWASGACERIQDLVSRAASSTKGSEEGAESRERYTPHNGKARQVNPARRLARLDSSTVSNGKYS
jgi:hypothetical protein